MKTKSMYQMNINVWEGIGNNNTQRTNLEKNRTKILPAKSKTSEKYSAP
jgi:hypothetical protein